MPSRVSVPYRLSMPNKGYEMGAQSLASLNAVAAAPPKLLSRTATGLEGDATVTLYVFRIPGRRDLCLTPSKPVGDVVTDMDVSSALYYVRFDEKPPSSRMTLLRRNPATDSTQEVGLIVEEASHIDVFASGYGLIEETFWRMNGLETMTIKSSFGFTVHHSDSSYHFLSPWTGRCTFLPVKGGHALRCSHTLRIPVEESVDISELRFNFSGRKTRESRNQYAAHHSRHGAEHARFSEDAGTRSSPSSPSSLQHSSFSDNSSKRRSLFSRSSDYAPSGVADVQTSKRKSFILPLQKRLPGRLSSADGGAALAVVGGAGPGQSYRGNSFAFENVKPSQSVNTGPDTGQTAPSQSVGSVTKTNVSVDSFSESGMDDDAPSMRPALPRRPLLGPRPMKMPGESSLETNPVSEASLESFRSHKTTVDDATRHLQSVSEESPLTLRTSELEIIDAPSTNPKIKRKPVGVNSKSEVSMPSHDRPISVGISSQYHDLPNLEGHDDQEHLGANCESGLSRGRAHAPDYKSEIPDLRENHQRAEQTSLRCEALPQAELPKNVEIVPQELTKEDRGLQQSSTRTDIDDPVMIEKKPPPLPPRLFNDPKDSTELDLSLGREKLGGGSDGEQAKLGKLIVWGEGHKMLDLIVSANVMMFYRAYMAANNAY